MDLKKLGSKPPFDVYRNWLDKVESGLRMVGLSNPDLLHPTSLVDMSYFILEDKF